MYHLDREIAEQPISVKNSFSNIMDDQEKVKSLFNEIDLPQLNLEHFSALFI